MRASGILLPVSSLPSRYGIGCFSRSAYEWIDFLREWTDVLADPAVGTDQLWRFSLSVIFHICGKSVFYFTGRTGGRGAFEQGGL